MCNFKSVRKDDLAYQDKLYMGNWDCISSRIIKYISSPVIKLCNALHNRVREIPFRYMLTCRHWKWIWQMSVMKISGVGGRTGYFYCHLEVVTVCGCGLLLQCWLLHHRTWPYKVQFLVGHSHHVISPSDLLNDVVQKSNQQLCNFPVHRKGFIYHSYPTNDIITSFCVKIIADIMKKRKMRYYFLKDVELESTRLIPLLKSFALM